MAFTVETGLGLTDSNAYTSLAYVNAYHSDRGNSKWTGDDTVKQQAIVRATSYVDKRWQKRFRGQRLNSAQSLQWPRYNAYREDRTQLPAMPNELLQAVAEYALRSLLYNVLAPDVPPSVPAQSMVTGSTTATTVASGQVTKEEKTVGPLTIIKEFADTSERPGTAGGKSGVVSSWAIPEYPEADLIIEALLTNSASRDLARA